MSKRNKAFSLIEILVVVVIIAALSASLGYFYLGKSGGKGAPPGMAHSPLERAHDTVCQNNLSQVRLAIQSAKTMNENEVNPKSLDELKLPSEILVCNEGKEPFDYNAEQGTVHCVHPGHEKY